MSEYYNNKRGVVPILLLLAALGFLVFIFSSSLFPFKDKLFNMLFPKPSSQAAEVKPPSVPDEILLKFKPGVSDKAKNNIKKHFGIKKKDEIAQIGVEIGKVPEKAKDKIIEALKKNPNIEYVEPNYIFQFEATPNDGLLYNAAWDLQKIGAPAAWDISKGSSSVVVAVLDTGVNANHEDLVGKIVPGYDFADNDSDTSDCAAGHGTIVSGRVGASTNNSKGIASLGWNTPILPLKVASNTNCVGGSSGIAATALIFAADHGAKVANMSFGGSGYSQTWQDAINYAWDRGMVITAAAGNYSAPGSIAFPASGEHVIAVGATDAVDNKAGFSATGLQLDVVAPGSYVYSTCPETISCYKGYSGTSFASPQVAVLAALIISANPGLNPQQVTDIITSTAKDLGAAGRDDSYGWGRINAAAALQKAIVTTPEPLPTPTSTPTPTPSPTSIPDIIPPTVSVTSPSDGQTVSGIVTISANASDDVAVSSVSIFVDNILVTVCSGASCSYSWNTTQETNGSHTIYASALDSSNNESQSSSVNVNVSNANPTPTPTPIPTPTPFVPTPTPAVATPPSTVDTQAPSVPAHLSATTVSSSQINLSWNPSTDNVGVVGYDIYRNNIKVATTTSTSYGDANLSSATTYSYNVRAKDIAGNVSNPSNTASATTSAPPVTVGGISGTVSSSLGGVLPGVKVSTFVGGAKITVVTNSLGTYALSNLPAGNYSLGFQFKDYINQTVNVVVNTNQLTTRNITMVKR